MAVDLSYESLNRQGSTLNAPGQLYGPDASAPAFRRALAPMDDEVVAPTPNERPRVLTRLPGEPAPALAADTDNLPAEAPVVLDGPFSAVRAARVAHQYRVDFWSPDSDVLGVLAEDDSANPSDAQLDTMYNDLALFSYLPAQLFPTRASFGEQSKPTQRAAYLATTTADVGVGTGVQTQTPAIRTFTGGTESGPILPVNTPFAMRIGTQCMDRFFDMALAQ